MSPEPLRGVTGDRKDLTDVVPMVTLHRRGDGSQPTGHTAPDTVRPLDDLVLTFAPVAVAEHALVELAGRKAR